MAISTAYFFNKVRSIFKFCRRKIFHTFAASGFYFLYLAIFKNDVKNCFIISVFCVNMNRLVFT